MKLIFATHNPGKLKEMRQILAGLKIEVISAEEAGINEHVIEDGKTFEENALKKAQFAAKKSGYWAIADDSGICIKALNYAPGVSSSRWAGEGASDEKIVKYTLSKIKNIPISQREAWMESVAVLAAPNGRHWTFSGKIEGNITSKPAGQPSEGMPYDAIFIPKGYNQTFAKMSHVEKNSLSHRGMAFRKLKRFIKKNKLN